jgi:4'-phosphopantetheinyl transferase
MIRLTLSESPAPYQLWRVDLGIDAESERECLQLLSAEERSRAARFVFARDRLRYVAAHHALRQILSRQTGVPPGALSFHDGPFGKPYVSGGSTCSFNLSHSGEIAAVAVAESGEIGIDVEVLRSIPDAQELAEENYTQAERAVLARVDAQERDLCFLLGWTRKEACLKAVGCGLNVAPRSFECGLTSEPCTAMLPTADGMVAVHVQSFCHWPDVVLSLARVLNAP